jgi:hypothetical protein
MNSQAKKLIDAALADVGYLEKKSNAQLDDKTANAGSGNWTKFGAWYGCGLNGQPWCAMAVSRWANLAGIPETVIPKFASCGVGVSWFKQRGVWHKSAGYIPVPGDIIFFTHDGKSPAHVGVVERVDSTRVYTIEGNTSGGSELIDNGGGVAKKSYPLNYAKILGYAHPAYIDETAGYKAIIQSRMKMSNPERWWARIDGDEYATDFYRKWAESYK